MQTLVNGGGRYDLEFISGIFEFLWSCVRTIRISDIVDMAIIAYLIYKVLTFISRTGSSRVFKGIVLLIAVLWLSDFAKLYVIRFLLGKTFELGIIALLILFQPEVRRMLESVGSSKLTKLIPRQERSEELELAIKQVIIACMEMSKARTGALIVFERSISLAEPIKTGTVIDAGVTSELIKNIFYHGAPLHDGAVIIRDGRVTAAGCLLPVSANTNISRELGTRHRAGIGMSEVSDAVVVVVSEETGAISVAIEGKLNRRLTESTFETLLRKELLPKPEDGKKATLISKVRSTINEKHK